jgi:ankyrin repeat protein
MKRLITLSLIITSMTGAFHTFAQVPPSAAERSRYTGLFAAALTGDIPRIRELMSAEAKADVRDSYGRTPLHVAAYAGRHDAMRALVDGGADPNALENDRYDIVTIAAVADDLPTLQVASDLGGDPRNITSRYDGTDLIESIVLGDGGLRHTRILEALVMAGADVNIPDRSGRTPLALARARGYDAMATILLESGARPFP